MVNLVVSLPTRGGPGFLMNVSVREHCALNSKTFLYGIVYYSNPIIITVLSRLSFPIVVLKILSLPTFALESLE